MWLCRSIRSCVDRSYDGGASTELRRQRCVDYRSYDGGASIRVSVDGVASTEVRRLSIIDGVASTEVRCLLAEVRLLSSTVSTMEVRRLWRQRCVAY